MEKTQCLIVTAYKNAEMLRQLLADSLPYCRCYVHVDRKAWEAFAPLQDEFPEVRFLSRYSVNWGSLEHLLAIVDLLKLAAEEPFEYAHIVSGEDYPVVGWAQTAEFFHRQNAIFMDVKPAWEDRIRKRWYTYYWPYVRWKQNYKKPAVRYMNLACVAAQCLTPWLNRKKLGEFTEIYGGLVWGSYPRDAVDYLLTYLDERPEFMKELRSCKIPEELCFHTILMNSPLRSRTTADSRHYGDMSRGNGWGPVYLDIEDLRQIDDSGAYFVRKVKYGSKLLEELRKRQSDAETP